MNYRDIKFDIFKGINNSTRSLNILPKKFFEYLLVKRLNKNINDYENIEDYLDGGISNNAKFNNDISQINIIIMEIT